MHTMKRIAYSPILEAVALYDIKERTALTMRDITQAHHLAVARDMTIDLLKQRNQFLDESLTLLKEQLTIASHLLFPYLHQRRIGLLLHLEQSITLLQSLVVVGQCLNVGRVVLRDDHIHQAASLLASTLNEYRIRRRDKDERYQSYML